MSEIGRPMKFSEPAQIEDAWQEYKGKCDDHTVEEVSAGKVVKVKRPKVYTLASFQVFIGISRESWGDYRTYEAFSDTIKGIEEEVLARKHEALTNGEGSTTGLIFDMKVNYKWQDKQVIEQKVELTSVEVKVVAAVDGAPIATSEGEVKL
jgi:hypothetical protein